MRSICISIVATLVLAGTSFADTITVCQSGCDYSDITSALEHASNGDVIEITPDDPMGYMPFTIDNHLTITINGNGATIQGMDDFAQTGVFVEGGVTVTINDLRITGNSTYQPGESCLKQDLDGAGMFVEGGATVTLNNCTISDNAAEGGGCAGEGGGIFVENGATVTLNGCTISDNDAGPAGEGGGIYVESGATVTLNHCMMSGNTPDMSYGPMAISTTGACCYDGLCFSITETECTEVGGTFTNELCSADTACPTPCSSDVDNDGDIDIQDLLQMLTDWGACP